MTSEELIETTQVNMEFADVKLASDEEGTQTMFIKALALDEGVWNGIYFNAEDIQEKIETLKGRRVLVSHQFESPDDVKGWVEGITSDGVASLRVFEADTISRVQSGELNSVSVGVQIQQTNGMATILDFNEISLTGNPACATCTISEYDVAMLEKQSEEDINMTEKEVVDETELTEIVVEEAELCACEPEMEAAVENTEEPTVLEEVVEEASLESIELATMMNTMMELESRLAATEAQNAELNRAAREAEMRSRVDILLDEARFKPAASESLVDFLMTLNDSQISAWSAVEEGLGPVVPLNDIGETGEFTPSEEMKASLTADKTAFRQMMGFKE